ncbi:MAG: toprim domain-containing protein [Bacteroides sp.]|nr:toprim domain-containing protein [Bacteroides sp.]
MYRLRGREKTKGFTIFGIDGASKVREKDNIIIVVEGAPDVLRLQSVGLDNVVTSLGTAWTDVRFNKLRKITFSICFIPDSNVCEEKLFGPGFEAVMTNGATAMKKRFVVTVKEISAKWRY